MEAFTPKKRAKRYLDGSSGYERCYSGFAASSGKM